MLCKESVMSEDTQSEVQAEGTAADSAAVETTQEGAETTESSDATESTESKKNLEEQVVPYSRFKEVNEKAKRAEELEARLKELESKAAPKVEEDEQTKQVKETLKNLGFVSKEELEVQKRQEREDVELDKKLTQLETKYSGADGKPKFTRQEIFDFYQSSGRISSDPEVLYKQKYEKELTDWSIQQALTKTKGTKSEASDGTGSAGTGSDDLRSAAMQGDKSALRTYLKRLAPR
jgi:hypothetical protein